MLRPTALLPTRLLTSTEFLRQNARPSPPRLRRHPISTIRMPLGDQPWTAWFQFLAGSSGWDLTIRCFKMPVPGIAFIWMYSIDKTLVTNQQFAEFVKATNYVTIAEQTPRAEDFPGAPPENLVAGSVLFSPPNNPVPLNDHFQWWSYVKGANWRHPQGPASDLQGKQTHPVVHIAYADAEAYCQWEDKRLPTEAEFEFAERGGLDRKPYAWGDEFKPGGKFMANTFQGHFSDRSTPEDGYATTSPAGAFPANGYGLFDMSGNVWEWTSDWYRPDYYQALADSGRVARNPQGPPESFDPSEPGVAKKVHRGGSFLCTDQYCSRYKVGGRGKGDPDTGTNHLGFRCVMPAVSASRKQ